MLTERDLQGRVRRLEQLAVGLAKEVSIMRAGDDPLLRLERVAYLGGVHDAIDGVEKARVTLVRVLLRLREVDDVRPSLIVQAPQREDAA